MAFCSKCGQAIPDGAAFCQSCGAPGPGSAGGPTPAAPAAGTGLQENVASGLCYVLGWLTGIIFFLVDHRPAVKFHAAQSIIVFGALHIIRIALGMVFGVGWFFGGMGALGSFGIGLALISLLGLVTLVLWVVLMIMGFQGKKFKVPIAGDFAENWAGR